MPTIPSTVQHKDAVVYGSCKVEISEDSGVTWSIIGAARTVVFNEQQTTTTIQSDNTEELANYVSEHNVNITLNALEFYLPYLDKIRGGIDILSFTTGGAKTTDTDVYTTGSKDYNVPYYFINQGDSTTLPAVLTVKSVDTDNASDTLDDTSDYATFTNSNDNRSGIIMIPVASGGGWLSTESLRIEYEYETIAARKLTSGGLSIAGTNWFRLTNKQIVSGVDKFRYFVVYSAAINAGLNLAFKSSYEADPALETPISLLAKLDVTRAAGDQLFYIEDEVGIS